MNPNYFQSPFTCGLGEVSNYSSVLGVKQVKQFTEAAVAGNAGRVGLITFTIQTGSNWESLSEQNVKNYHALREEMEKHGWKVLNIWSGNSERYPIVLMGLTVKPWKEIEAWKS